MLMQCPKPKRSGARYHQEFRYTIYVLPYLTLQIKKNHNAIALTSGYCNAKTLTSGGSKANQVLFFFIQAIMCLKAFKNRLSRDKEDTAILLGFCSGMCVYVCVNVCLSVSVFCV